MLAHLLPIAQIAWLAITFSMPVVISAKIHAPCASIMLAASIAVIPRLAVFFVLRVFTFTMEYVSLVEIVPCRQSANSQDCALWLLGN